MNTPKELRYSKDHEWIKVEGNKVRVGITDFAQSELGDIVFVELPEVDDEITADESFGSVESVKTVSELYAPISGKVVAVNENLDDDPQFVNESPYENGWIIEVEVTDTAQLEQLMTAEQYEEMVSK
ncbi:glycine cleavage system protein GcvH [Niallia sp. XMNu-256]|uniref:glycine cleavage system protein GcvH n=1 Tax=Niallia sp. XMNu-256 TaxID=3082444 RepID=UPI0030D11A14